METENVQVILLKPVDYYEPGTLCGYPKATADRLVSMGAARYVEPIATEVSTTVAETVEESPVNRAMPSPAKRSKKG